MCGNLRRSCTFAAPARVVLWRRSSHPATLVGMRQRDRWEIRLFASVRWAAENEARRCGVLGEDARDIGQEALVIVARHLERETFVFLSADPIEQVKIAKAYLRRIARRLAIAHQEEAKLRREAEHDRRPPLVETAEAVDARLDVLFLLACTDLANARAILGWAMGEGAWETSIAQGVGENTVQTRRGLALRDLQAAARRERARADGLPRVVAALYREVVPHSRVTLWFTASEAERVERYLEQERARAVEAGQREPKDSPLLVMALLRGIELDEPKPAPKRAKKPSSKAPPAAKKAKKAAPARRRRG